MAHFPALLLPLAQYRLASVLDPQCKSLPDVSGGGIFTQVRHAMDETLDSVLLQFALKFEWLIDWVNAHFHVRKATESRETTFNARPLSRFFKFGLGFLLRTTKERYGTRKNLIDCGSRP
jgi:hypothetical protein